MRNSIPPRFAKVSKKKFFHNIGIFLLHFLG